MPALARSAAAFTVAVSSRQLIPSLAQQLLVKLQFAIWSMFAVQRYASHDGMAVRQLGHRVDAGGVVEHEVEVRRVKRALDRAALARDGRVDRRGGGVGARVVAGVVAGGGATAEGVQGGPGPARHQGRSEGDGS